MSAGKAIHVHISTTRNVSQYVHGFLKGTAISAQDATYHTIRRPTKFRLVFTFSAVFARILTADTRMFGSILQLPFVKHLRSTATVKKDRRALNGMLGNALTLPPTENVQKRIASCLICNRHRLHGELPASPRALRLIRRTNRLSRAIQMAPLVI